MSKPDGGPAFPTQEFFDEKLIGAIPGMSRRFYAACAAMPVLAPIAPVLRDVAKSRGMKESAVIAAAAFEIADALIEQESK